MSDWTGITQALSGTAQAVIALGGFGLIVVQLRQLKKAIEGDTQGKLYDHYVKVTDLLLQKPYLRPYFYDGKDWQAGQESSKSQALRYELNIMCEAFLGLLEHATLQQDNLSPDARDNCWKAYTLDRLKNSPVLRDFYKQYQGCYAVAFRDIVDSSGIISTGLPPHRLDEQPRPA